MCGSPGMFFYCQCGQGQPLALFLGALRDFTAPELGGLAIKEAVRRAQGWLLKNVQESLSWVNVGFQPGWGQGPSQNRLQ
jgi:hypothetical protein